MNEMGIMSSMIFADVYINIPIQLVSKQFDYNLRSSITLSPPGSVCSKLLYLSVSVVLCADVIALVMCSLSLIKSEIKYKM